jgi:predicted small lipoprotein YifL
MSKPRFFPPGFYALAVCILAFLVAVWTVSGCGDDGPVKGPDDNITALIQACIADGGHPSFSSDQYGEPVRYFGCMKGTP